MSLNSSARRADHSLRPVRSESSGFSEAARSYGETSCNEYSTQQVSSQPTSNSPSLSRSDTQPALHFTLDSADTIVAVNLPGLSCIGYTQERVIGQPFMTLVHPHDRELAQTELAAVSRCSSHQWQGRLRLLAAERSVWQQVTMQALSGKEPLLLITCTAITSQPSMSDWQQNALRQQAEWEKLMWAIAQPIRESLDLRCILHTAVEAVQHSLQADRVLIYRTYTDGSVSILEETTANRVVPLLPHPQATAVLQRHPLEYFSTAQAIADLRHTADFWAEILEPLHIRAEIVVPIREGEQLWGVLTIHQCYTPRQWQPWEMGLLNQLAAHLEGIIYQTELYQQVQRLNADLERQIHVRTAQLELAFDFEATLKRITDKVRDSLEEDQILETAVHELVCAIGVNCCNAAIYDLETGTSTIRYEYTTTVSPYHGRVVQLDAFPEIYDQLIQGQAFQFCSLIHNPHRGRSAVFTCPIVDDQGALGDLWLINQPYYGFSEQDIRLVQQVANQCAIAIRQARLYQAAQAQVKELERLSRLKDDFLSTVSHELRTPITSIKMAAQMLEITLRKMGLLQDAANQRVIQYFQILQSECQREISLINNLLDLSRLNAELELKPIAIDLPIWLKTTVQSFVEHAHSRQQQLHLDLPAALPPLTVDVSHLERILTELLHNACKYTPDGGRITVTVAIDRDPALVLLLSVINAGIEIPEHELPHIFEKFYRVPNGDPWQHGGTGLGLALVQKLTERLGATIQVESAEGRTCFTLCLPLAYRGAA